MAKVRNRAFGSTFYTIPEFNGQKDFTRIFGPGEVKDVSEQELEALMMSPGGKDLVENYLQIIDKDVSDKLIYNKEPEYDMTEEDVKELMLHGSYDAFLDCLDFAPRGVIDLIKSLAVSLPLNDSAKRDALREKYHYDVDKILMNMRADENEDPAEPVKERRVQVAESAPQRRTTTGPHYNIKTV